MTNGMGGIRLPGYAQPETLPPTPAVGFSPSSTQAQQAPITTHGQTARFIVGYNSFPGQILEPPPVELINTAFDGTAYVENFSGTAVWLGFDPALLTQYNGYRLRPGGLYTLSPVIPLYAICDQYGFTNNNIQIWPVGSGTPPNSNISTEFAGPALLEVVTVAAP